MYTVLCATLLAWFAVLLINVIRWFRHGRRSGNFQKRWAFIQLPFYAAVGGALAGLVLGMLLFTDAPKVYVETGRYQMHSMKSTSGVSGDFWLGCGSIDSHDYYSYYLVQSNGALHKYSAEVSQSDIFEENRTDGVLVTYEARARGQWQNWTLKDKTSIFYYQFFIPRGSVRQNFSLE